MMTSEQQYAWRTFRREHDTSFAQAEVLIWMAAHLPRATIVAICDAAAGYNKDAK